MPKVRLKIFNQVEERSGVHPERGPWEIREQLAQVDGGANLPSYPFAIRLDAKQNPYIGGLYTAELTPQQGRFRNTVEWVMKDFQPVTEGSK